MAVASPPPRRIAIACQGGGSHAAFTAGVLDVLLRPENAARFELVGLSGTSGGAVCAALAWSGLLAGGPEEARARLDAFWEALAAHDPLDRFVNDWAQWTARLPLGFREGAFAPLPIAADRLRTLLAHHLRLEALPEPAARPSLPALRIGAANVLEGGGTVFFGETLTVEEVVASAAVPPLFPTIAVRGGQWWDGLFAHNPPLRHLLELRPRPREIWVVRLNPRRAAAPPTTAEALEDRRNELAGNLPLDHELHLIAKINELRAAAPALAWRYDAITVREVELDLPLGYASKLDRRPEHLAALRARGAALAPRLFEEASVVVRPPLG